jgi:hypothetical protein
MLQLTNYQYYILEGIIFFNLPVHTSYKKSWKVKFINWKVKNISHTSFI